jgi:Icc-related predicted phosphoesterase
MRILTIVDIHKSENALETTKRYIEKYSPDLLLIAGDITTFGPLEFAEQFLNGLPNITTLALPGNCDPKEILQTIHYSPAINLHSRMEKIGGITFVGLGGSNATPFNTPFELDENKIYKILDSIMVHGEVLVLHFPAKGHLDKVPRGNNTGSESAGKIINTYRPALVISGHIHETRGSETDEHGTVYINPGPMKDGYAALVNITIGPQQNQQGMGRYKIDVTFLPE